jgi:very-short-patch-repair endonuclease
MKYKKWTFEVCQKEALKYDNRTAFRLGCSGAHNAAQQKGWMTTICSHMKEAINSPYTFKELHDIALKYTNRPDFRNFDKSAHDVAERRGLLPTICSHMEIKYEYINNERIVKEALKYKSRSEFFKNSPKEYYAASDRKMLDQICSHMKYKSGVSFLEENLSNIIKKFYPSIKKLRDRKVKIEGKAYIKGFDIDIFIPELNLGIEFDGDYHHSFEYMRKCKKKSKWTDNDIRNYHEIKDAYFLSKGIKILHIKEEDWLKNKENCVQKCLIFLSTEKNA